MYYVNGFFVASKHLAGYKYIKKEYIKKNDTVQ